MTTNRGLSIVSSGKTLVNMRPLHFICMLGLACFLPSCKLFDYEKVGEYPLHGNGGYRGAGTSIEDEIKKPVTIGEGLGNTGEQQPDPNDPPILPDPGQGGLTTAPPISSPQTGTTTTNSTPPKATTGTNYPLGIPIPGDPTRIRSPYDGREVIIMRNGRPHPSGTKIRAQGETDPSRIFIVP